MQRPSLPIFAAIFALLVALTPLTLPRAAAADPDVTKLVSSNIKTLQLDSQIVLENREELSKISGDIALAYRLHRGSVAYEQPGKLRIEASIPHFVSGYYIINGNKKLTSAPFVHQVQDVTGAPGKKQTLLDFGFLSPEQLTEYDATYLRTEDGLYVYQVMPKIKTEPLKDIIWIDPKTRITVKRLNYNRDGKLIKWFLYKNAIEISPGVYIPTRVELYNPENHLAGATTYSHIRVNQPLAQSLFQI